MYTIGMFSFTRSNVKKKYVNNVFEKYVLEDVKGKAPHG